MAMPHKGIALLMGEPDDDEHEGTEPEDGEGPSGEEREAAKKDAAVALIHAVHASKPEEVVAAFETLAHLCYEEHEEDEGEPSSPDLGAEDEEDEDRP